MLKVTKAYKADNVKIKFRNTLYALSALVTLSVSSSSALHTRFSWLPEGRMTYQGFSVRPDRLPSYSNREVYKSFLLEVFWRYPLDTSWGIDVRALQAGRTAAIEKVGSYQSSPMILSVQHWELLMERDLIRTPNGFLAGLGGIGAVTNQFERTKDVFVNGVKVNTEIGLSDEGAAGSGLRTSVENIAIPLGIRWRRELRHDYYTELLVNYSFLMDFTDFLSGSSPFSGWANQIHFSLGKKLSPTTEFFIGYFGYTNHMAAPAGQGGLRLRAGAAAPEGVYVLYQENEVSLSAALVGFGIHF